MAPAVRNPMILAGALLLSLAARGARAEFPAFPFSSIPPCVTTCVEKAGCDVLDLQCMCDKASGRFLPEVATCVRAGCDASLSVDAVLEPLVNTCGTLDAPVPSAAVSSAREAATGDPSAVPKPTTAATGTTLTTATGAGSGTPAASTSAAAPETTAAGTTTSSSSSEGETTPTGTADSTSPVESSPSSAPPESAAPSDRASLLGASMGILLMLAVAW